MVIRNPTKCALRCFTQINQYEPKNFLKKFKHTKNKMNEDSKRQKSEEVTNNFYYWV